MANEEKNTENGFACLSVTAVQVFPLSRKVGNLLGMASVVLNNQLQINGLRIMDGGNGLFVGYPPNPLHKSDSSRYSALPITRVLREHIETCVLEKYKYEQDTANVTFDVELTHSELSGASMRMEVIAPTETEAESKAKERATEFVPSTKGNGEWTIIKVTKHE